MHDIKRILVVSRWTYECKKALHYGISLARSYHAELSILHIIRDTFEMSGGVMYMPRLADLEEGYKSMVDEVKRDFDAMIAEEQATGMVIKETIKDGEPAVEIFKAVKTDKIDLLVDGSPRGRSHRTLSLLPRLREGHQENALFRHAG